MSKNLNLTLKVWRQNKIIKDAKFETHKIDNVSSDMSFLEMIDFLNDKLVIYNKEPIAFDHDCREGICGMCGFMVNGKAHGSQKGTTLCQLHMRHFESGDVIIIEPFRALAFKVLKDLVVDRSSLDKIIQAGGFISVNTGSPEDANNVLIAQDIVELAMDAAQCIGCGACIASCPNASSLLFASAKISQLMLLPQGKLESCDRTLRMIKEMGDSGFGYCSNHRECELECPKEISISNIARVNREFIRATFISNSVLN